MVKVAIKWQGVIIPVAPSHINNKGLKNKGEMKNCGRLDVLEEMAQKA